MFDLFRSKRRSLSSIGKFSLKKLEEKIIEKLKIKQELTSNLKICVACSSGLDSTSLLYLLSAASHVFPSVKIAIAHVNYNLRAGESKQDEIFLEKLAKEKSFPFFVHHPKKTLKVQNKKGIQLWARNERYDFFESLIQKGWLIALAHTENDLFENLLFRIGRGTSPIASLGMSENHKNFWRPMLDIRKEELLVWAKEKKFLWREDLSNQETVYARNRLRHEVIPSLEEITPGASSRFIRFAEQSQELAGYVRSSLKGKLPQFILVEEERLEVSLEFFKDLNKSTICLALADLLRDFQDESYVPEHKNLMTLCEWILKSPCTKGKIQLAQDMFCKISKNKLIFTRS